MEFSVISYNGWNHCLRIANTEIELIVTLEAGPRIIRCGFLNERNEFQEYPEQILLRNDGKYHSYGGHRLWAAPEIDGWTNHPDNNPVDWKQAGDSFVFTAPPETGTHLQKQLSVVLASDRNRIEVTHTITNRSTQDIVVAPWAISVMAPGGTAFIPQEPFIPHPQRVLPVRPLVLWSYTDMTDSRWTWGSRYIRLRQDASAKAPQKFGARISQGWAAYYNAHHLFVKQFPCFADASYPDFGCNAEFFTNNRMLEVESLGPLVTLTPGNSVSHKEIWHIFKDVTIPSSDDELDLFFNSLLKSFL